MKADLRQIGVIVTRPEAQAESLLNRIHEHGGKGFLVPALAIVNARNSKGAKRILSQSDQNDYFLFTSPNSVIFAKKLGFKFPVDKGYISIGLGTEKALHAEGITHDVNDKIITAPKPYTSEALIETLKSYDLTDQSVLIVSGEGGRRLLGDALTEQGAKTKYVNVYRRVKPKTFALEPVTTYIKEHPVLLTLTSSEAIDTLLPALQDAELMETIDAVIVGSDRLANHAIDVGFHNPIVAQSALEDDLWDAIVTYSESLTQTDNNEATMQENNDTKKTPKEELESIETADTVGAESSNSPAKNDTPEKKSSAKSDVIGANNKKTNKTNKAKKEFVEMPLGPTPEESTPVVTEKVVEKKGGGIAWLACAIALGSLGFSSYLYLNPPAQKAIEAPALDTSHIDNAIATLKGDLSSVQSQLQTLPKTAEKVDLSGLDSAQKAIENLTKKVDNLTVIQSQNQKMESMIEALKEANSALQTDFNDQKVLLTGITDLAKDASKRADTLAVELAQNKITQDSTIIEARELIKTIKNTTDLDTFKLAEIEYLLKFAKYKLEYERDTDSAINVLETAKARMAGIEAIPFTVAIGHVDATLEMLKTFNDNNQHRDVTAAKLFEITKEIAHAPLKEDGAIAAFRDKIYSTQKEIETDKAWYKNILSSLVFVEQETVEPPKLMAELDSLYIQHNIQVQLSAARLALLQNMPALHKDSVTLARTWIVEYFDPRDASVAKAVAELDLMLEQDYSQALPDVTPAILAFSAAIEARQPKGGQ